MSDRDRIARLRITLVDTDPAVWRVVEVPVTTSLRALHVAIQAAMPWEDCHLYEFRIGEARFGSPDLDGHLPIRDARNVRLTRFVAEDVSAFTYVYDFGDHWQHTVAIEAVCDGEPGTEYPLYVEGVGRAPPEDVGGTPGFEEFLKAVTRPKAREHRRMVEWYGGPFDPAEVDVATITARLGKLARRRAMGKAAGTKNLRKAH